MTDLLSASPDPTSSGALRRMAEEFADLGRGVFGHEGPSVADASELLVKAAAHRVPGTAAASITTLRGDRFSTIASTEDFARAADELQYTLRSGPCVDAIIDERVFSVPDLRNDPRWPEFGPQAAQMMGIGSMLSFRLSMESSEIIAGLNLYATKAHAFDDNATHVGLLLATYGALLVNAAAARTKVAGLERALETSREIGIAVGVLMSRYKVTREQAFDLLSIASQQLNRKLRELAGEVADTGELPPAVISRLHPGRP